MADRRSDFRLGDWLVSPMLNRISKGDESFNLKHKAMAVLVRLADANGEVVTRDEIMDAVWPGMAVTDDVLTQSIAELRKAFADDAKHPHIIETIPRVGLRLVADVVPALKVTSTSRTTWLRRSILLTSLTVIAVGFLYWLIQTEVQRRSQVITVHARPSIAVLPFVNMSEDPVNRFLADGVAEEIRILLAKSPGLKVIGRNSVHAVTGLKLDLRDIGQALGVTHILEGAVRRADDDVRISAQLIDASDGTSLWSDSYDREMTDMFAVQDSVAAAVIEALQVHVGTIPRRGRPTENFTAYTLFLRARDQLHEFDARLSREYLIQAIELDASYAEAHETLAYSIWLLAGSDIEAVEAQTRVHEAASKALALDPDLELARALYLASRPGPFIRWRKLQAFERAAAKLPGNPLILETYLFSLTESGYVEEALQVAERFVAIDPLSQVANTYWACALYAAGRTDEALAAAQFSDQLDLESIDGIYVVENRHDIAIEHFDSYLRELGYAGTNWAAELMEKSKHAEFGQGYIDSVFGHIVESMQEIDTYNWQQGLTAFYLFFGFLDRHFELILETEPDATTWHTSGIHMWRGNVFNRMGFTSHPRYVELATRLGIVATWEQRGPPDFCEKVDGQWICE